MRKYQLIQGSPVSPTIAPAVRYLIEHTGATLNSGLRTDDLAPVLHAQHPPKHTQRELYVQMHGVGVNPPDRGSHVGIGDGTVGKLYATLPEWQHGLDFGPDAKIPAILALARKMKWDLRQPYSSHIEYHHLNFYAKPRMGVKRFIPVRKGDSGDRVVWIQETLNELGFNVGKADGQFGDLTKSALKHFQKSVKLAATGVYGPKTSKALHKAKEGHTEVRKPHTSPHKPVVKPAYKKPTGISHKGVEMITRFEGGQNPHDGLFHPYWDKYGKVWTIGYGHTGGVSAKSKPLTKTQAEELLRKDINTKYAPGALSPVKVRINQNQADALISLVYNIGPGAFANSTLLKELNKGNIRKAADEFLHWNKGANGQMLPGLTKRRAVERALFLK